MARHIVNSEGASLEDTEVAHHNNNPFFRLVSVFWIALPESAAFGNDLICSHHIGEVIYNTGLIQYTQRRTYRMLMLDRTTPGNVIL